MRGEVSGITPATESRAVCYCDDCQIYALHLGTPGILDARGGTDACLLTPAQVKITAGMEQLRCLRLSPKGLYRWYAGCCNTPLGNTVSPSLPVVVLVHSCMDHGERSRDEDLGQPKVKMLARFAVGGLPPGAHAKTPVFKMLPHFVAHLAKAYLGGRGKPSPFWDEHRKLRVEPTLIDQGEREALRARVLAAAKLTP
jgi:hypothetical protein